MLREKTLFGNVDKVEIALDRLRTFEPPEGYFLAFSGGKDSIVVKNLAIKSGVKYDAHYNITTVDPPELIRYVKKFHPDVQRDRPRINMWDLCLKKVSLPSRLIRFCCEELKERGGDNRFVVTGIRAAESINRRSRKMVENCFKHQGKRYLHVIFDWSEEDVWQYIRENDLPYCKLYDEGMKRIGCVMCPMSGHIDREAKRFPRIAEMYRRTANKIFDLRQGNGKIYRNFKNGDDLYNFWLTGKGERKDIPGQMLMFD